MAALCPSFEVASKALKGIGIDINQNLLQNITSRFVDLAMNVRVECHSEEVWQKPGIKIKDRVSEIKMGNLFFEHSLTII